MKAVDIKVLVRDGASEGEKDFKVGVITPLGSFVKTVSVKTTDEMVSGMIDICDQLNEKKLGFTIAIKQI